MKKLEEKKERMKGVISWYDPNLNYGFLEGNDGKSYFLHKSELKIEIIVDCLESVNVTFIPSKTDRGLKALDVQVIESESE